MYLYQFLIYNVSKTLCFISAVTIEEAPVIVSTVRWKFVTEGTLNYIFASVSSDVFLYHKRGDDRLKQNPSALKIFLEKI